MNEKAPGHCREGPAPSGLRHGRLRHATCPRLAPEHLSHTTISALAVQLDAGRFQQIDRSTIVHLDPLAGTRRDGQRRLYVRVRGRGEELPVSRACVHLFKAMLPPGHGAFGTMPVVPAVGTHSRGALAGRAA